MLIKKATAELLRKYMPYINMEDPVSGGVALWKDIKQGKVDGSPWVTEELIARALSDEKGSMASALKGSGGTIIDKLENLFDYTPSFSFDLKEYDNEIAKATGGNLLAQSVDKEEVEKMHRGLLSRLFEVLNTAYFVELIKGLSKRVKSPEFKGYSSPMRRNASRVVLRYLNSI